MKTLTDAEIEKVRRALRAGLDACASDQRSGGVLLIDQALSILSSAHVVDAEPVAWRCKYCGFIECNCDNECHAKPSAMSVPDGWKLVPIEPTTEMLERGMGPFLAAHDPMFMRNEPCGPIWKSMLTAAPSNTATVQIDERKP